MNDNPAESQPIQPTQPSEPVSPESQIQSTEQVIQSDFPDPLAMASQSPQTQVAPITSAQANQAINQIDAAEHDKKNVKKLLSLPQSL